MKIFNKNLKSGSVGVEITNNEDLWYLSHVIEENDLISGKTERKIKIGSDENAKTVRKSVFLKIRTTKTEYVPENNALRILGVIIEGTDDVALGEHHSFNLELRERITIQKRQWPGYLLDKLNEATKEKSKILMVAFDREEAKFAILKNSGYSILSELKGDVQKKEEQNVSKGNFYKEIVKQIEEYVTRLEIHNIIIASPAFWKEYLLKELPEDLKKKTVSATISGVDNSSFSELLKRNELKKVLENERTSKELNAIDQILSAIEKDKACYGIKETKQKVVQGATSKLFVSENLLKEMKEKEKYPEIDRLLKDAENIKTKILIISGKESSKKLDGLGGIAGLLRW